MAIAVVARTSPQVRLSAAASGTGSANRTVTNPGCLDGEFLIGIQSQTAGTDAGMTAPLASGFAWQQRGSTGGSGTVGRMKIWYRTALNEPSTWVFGGDGDGNVIVLVISNWDSRGDTFLWDVEPTFNTGTSATQVSPDISPDRTKDRVIRAWASETGGAAHSTAGGYVEHQDVAANANNSMSVQSIQNAATGPTGTVNSTGGAVDYVAVAFALYSPPNEASALSSPSVTLPHWSTAQNVLVVNIGANSAGSDTANSCKVSSVVDDAHNNWVEGSTDFAASSGDSTTSVRSSIWYCTNAAAIRQLTVTMTETVDSLAIQVIEASGLTNVSAVDVANHGNSASAAGATASGTTANANDLIIAGAVVGDSGVTFAHTADTWTANDTTNGLVVDVATAATTVNQDNTLLRGAYKILSLTGAQTTAWTLSPSGGVAWSLLALKGGTPSTTNPNPNWPTMTHEFGFGTDPNDPTIATSWTGVTTRALSFTTRRGRDYELTRTEAGEADVRMRNDDGALDPSNTSGAYYPNVKVFVPYRIRAVWNGNTYPVFTGYVERWPQGWDNEYGSSPLVAVDGFATLAATRLEGTLGAEILADAPTAYWPLDDGTLATTAANKSRTTTNPLLATTSSNHGGGGFFGVNLDLQGEESTCWQQTRSITDVGDAPNSVYGVCLAAQMTALPQLSNGILIECWAKVSGTSTGQDYGLLGLKASAFSADPQRRVALVFMDSLSGTVAVNVYSSSGVAQGFNSGVSGLNNSVFHHYVLHLTTTTIKFWIDGVQRIDAILPSVPANPIDRIFVGGLADEFSNQNFAVGYFAHVAVFRLATADPRRIAVRANAGLFGFPEKSGARMSRLLNYASWSAGRSIDTGLALLGPAATITNQTLLAAVQDVANWENGVVFVDSGGRFRFIDRGDRFNQTTRWVFGENESAGELPYETDVSIDFDPKYVFNDVQITRTAGATSSGNSSARLRDQASIKSYFTRNLDKTSGVASISQCTNEAAWALVNYAQPRMRLARITIVPSANPNLWPVALGAEIGDRVTVRRQPFGGAPIDLDCYIEQVAHRVVPNRWETVFSLSPVLLTTYPGETGWILNASTLDVDTIFG